MKRLTCCYPNSVKMKKQCKTCNVDFSGRADKLFCSLKCKNEHHVIERRKTQTNKIVKQVDGYLHRNREILQTLMPNGVLEKIDRYVLDKCSFRWNFFTGIYVNKDGKTYYYVYDYAWMPFSDLQVLVVKDKKR